MYATRERDAIGTSAWPRVEEGNDEIVKHKRRTYLAVDLGAGSGRALLGTLDGGRLELREVHRFANGPVDLGGRC